VMRLAGSIGHQFDERTLWVISERPRAEVAADVGAVLQEGLLVMVDSGAGAEGTDAEPNPTYRFLHDRVQQAASSLIDEAQKPAVHRRVGRLMRKGGRGATDDRLFDIVGHMNRGVALIEDSTERRALARLNLLAGIKARAAAAYDAAAKLLGTCLELLG